MTLKHAVRTKSSEICIEAQMNVKRDTNL